MDDCLSLTDAIGGMLCTAEWYVSMDWSKVIGADCRAVDGTRLLGGIIGSRPSPLDRDPGSWCGAVVARDVDAVSLRTALNLDTMSGAMALGALLPDG